MMKSKKQLILLLVTCLPHAALSRARQTGSSPLCPSSCLLAYESFENEDHSLDFELGQTLPTFLFSDRLCFSYSYVIDTLQIDFARKAHLLFKSGTDPPKR